MDGYFPSELQGRFPDGVPFEVWDCLGAKCVKCAALLPAVIEFFLVGGARFVTDEVKNSRSGDRGRSFPAKDRLFTETNPVCATNTIALILQKRHESSFSFS